MTAHQRAMIGAAVAADPVVTEYDGDGRVITVRIVSWNREYTVTDDGATFYRELFIPGGLNGQGPALLGHDPSTLPAGASYVSAAVGWNGQQVGRIVRSEIRPDGLYAAVLTFDTSDGRDLVTLYREGVPIGVSAEFDDDVVTPAAGELVTHSAAELVAIAFSMNPQHNDAGAVAVREIPLPLEDPEMSDTPTPPPADPPADPTPTPPASTPPATARREAPTPNAGAGAMFDSVGHFFREVASGNVDPAIVHRFYRALQVGNVADIAGLMATNAGTSIIDIYRTLTPAVQAFTVGQLPATGMTVTEPIITQRPTVTRQTAEGNDVSSTKATIGNATWSVHTYGGGQQTSIQAILRSSPSYLDAMYQLYIREMAIAVDTAVALDIYAASNDVNTTSLEYVTAAAFDEVIIDASAQFLDTLHRPAEVVLISVDLWSALGKAKGSDGHPIYPALNPSNRSGSMSATQADGSIVAVQWYVEPALGGVGDGIKGVVGVREAYKTLLGETGQMQADVPISLERDFAVFQFVAHGKVDAAGLMQIANAA